MRSIQGTLTRSIVLSILGLLLVSGFVIEEGVKSRIEGIFDEALMDKAKAFATLTEYDATIDVVELEFADEVMTEYGSASNLEYFQLSRNGIGLVERSNSLSEHLLPKLNTEAGESKFLNLTLPDGRLGRLIEYSFVARVDDEDEEDDDNGLNDNHIRVVVAGEPVIATIGLAKERESLDAEISFMRNVIFIVMGIAAIGSGLLTHFLIKRGLHPLRVLANQVQQIDESNLGESISSSDFIPTQELAPIEEQLEELTVRLNEAFVKTKRFSSDAAHELFTPIAELKTLAEVGKKCLDTDFSAAEFLDDAEAIAVQMQDIVDVLLELTSLSDRDIDIELSPIYISQFIDEIWRIVNISTHLEKELVNRIPTDLIIVSDPGKLKIIIRNLLCNAGLYSDKETVVAVFHEQTLENGLYSIFIENRTSLLNENDLVNMRDRFWRKDASRSSSKNFGLGLALVDSLVSVLDLSLELSLSKDKQFVAAIHKLKV